MVQPRSEVGSVPTEPEGRTTERALSLPQSTALIMGSIIGVGIFSLPYALASYGPISLVAMGLATVGAVALALMFAVMSRRLPAAGGPYAYARSGFGNAAGFVNAWSYWITAWAGNAAIVVGWVYYVEHFLNKDGAVGWSILIALVGLWIPAVINLTGVRAMGSVQVWTTVLKFIPLAIMSTVGLLFIKAGNFTPWNLSGDSSLSAIGGAMAIALFSYLGVETAAVAAAKVRDPERNVPKATIYGTLASAIVYLLSMVAVFGIVPASQLAMDVNKASYSVAANSIVGGGSWAGDLVALAVIVSGIGALNGWTMICAEMPLAAAKDGLFPARFGGLSRRRVPAFGIIASTALASVAVVISYLGTSGSTVFTTLVLMTGITAAVPYAFSALVQIKWRWRDSHPVHTSRFVFDVSVAIVALIFSVAFIYYSRNTSDLWYVVWGPFLMAGGAFVVGIPVYLAQRHRMTEPAPVPEYR
ncbi:MULTISPECIES: amino acid permease [Cryobacterium]|uniref:Amino acid permease n=1 Tax=Cryobacterium breve TaxID=1259258 RepID=A0ABY2J003_9MICO|nr:MULTISPECIES: amino acid permease [Cryobacterium]TFC91740.1 amino acid permease [Cryobacterium sp. TmT3-12]TFC98289.1 amino acid permease [Cryobacterium breve]